MRGLGEDRVRILQNGTSVLDVSNVSPDHAVSVDPLTIRSVEVVRGPGTLLYGPNTIGGVVNVIDDRIPQERFTGTYPGGKFETRVGSVDDLFPYSGMDSDYGTVAEPDVTIGLHQRRWDMRGAVYGPAPWIKEINYKIGHSDYDHTEFEGSEVGTRFRFMPISRLGQTSPAVRSKPRFIC